MAILQGIGELSYNGVDLGGSTVSSRARIEPVWAEDGRSIMSTKIDIEAHATVLAVNPSDGTKDGCGVSQSEFDGTGYLVNSEKLYALLSQAGQPLKFNDKIFGQFNINTGDDLVDVNFGPKPVVGSITPIAANRSFDVTWSVSTEIGRCPSKQSDGTPLGTYGSYLAEGDVKQISYGVQWFADNAGYTTRTVSGFIDIVSCPALHRDSITISADDYREKFTVDSPIGYRRVQNAWVMHPNKSRIEFTITDEEIRSQNAYPVGVAEIDVSHTAAIGVSTGLAKIMNTISGSCEMANGYSSADAWERVFPIIANRILAARAVAGGVMFQDFSVTENIFRRSISFNIGYVIIYAGANPAGIPSSSLSLSGLFLPTADTWEAYRESMWGDDPLDYEAGKPWSPRSVAGMTFDPENDAIVTPCTPRPVKVGVASNVAHLVGAPSQSSLSNICPPRNASYLKYFGKWSVGVRSGATGFREMPATCPTVTPTTAATSEGIQLTYGMDSVDQRIRRQDASAVSPDIILMYSGYGARMGFPVELPTTITQYGVTLDYVPDGSLVEDSVINYLGCTVYMKKWAARYKVAKSSSSLASSLGLLLASTVGTPDDPNGYKMGL